MRSPICARSSTRWRTRAPDPELRLLRRELPPRGQAATRQRRPQGRGRVMEAMLLGIYAFFVWLIFIKFKWLPWNTGPRSRSSSFRSSALTALILTLNVVAPSSADVRVIKYVVQVMPQVRGRVIEVPVEPNRLVKKGELLFSIDPTPYQNDLNVAKAKLAADEAKLAQAGAGLVDASAGARQLQEQLKSANGQVRALQPRLDLARRACGRTANWWPPAPATASRSNRPRPTSSTSKARSSRPRPTRRRWRRSCPASSTANRPRWPARARSSPPPRPRSTPAAPTSPTRSGTSTRPSVYAPANGYAINVQLRPGSIVVALPVAPAMTFVEEEYQVIALYAQNELVLVEPGNHAEFALPTYPGASSRPRSIRSSGRRARASCALSGTLPQTGAFPQAPGRFPVKLEVERTRPRALPGRRRRRPWRDLHRTRAGDPHPSHGDPARRLDHRLPGAEAALMRAAPRLASVVVAALAGRRWRAARCKSPPTAPTCRATRWRTPRCRGRSRPAATWPRRCPRPGWRASTTRR